MYINAENWAGYMFKFAVPVWLAHYLTGDRKCPSIYLPGHVAWWYKRKFNIRADLFDPGKYFKGSGPYRTCRLFAGVTLIGTGCNAINIVWITLLYSVAVSNVCLTEVCASNLLNGWYWVLANCDDEFQARSLSECFYCLLGVLYENVQVVIYRWSAQIILRWLL